MITTRDLDDFFKGMLGIEEFAAIDSSQNGLQVDNDGTPVKKIAFAVDASMETFKQTIRAGATMVFVHHGLLWGAPLRATGIFRRRLQFLLDNNIALYAVHLPLDQHPSLGNNAGLADLLGLTNRKPFGAYHGCKIGYKGSLSPAINIDDAVTRIRYMDRTPAAVYPFGAILNRTCAVVSGGAADLVTQALEEGVDLYVTGESSHSYYHHVFEGRLNMIAGGHYNTEVWGVRRVMEKCSQELPIEVEFIDIPTGL
jgi:dinuclear metal center YbgI/SA1388 family protein